MPDSEVLEPEDLLTDEDIASLRLLKKASGDLLTSHKTPSQSAPKEIYQSEYVNVRTDLESLIEILRYDYVSFILLFLHEQEGIELGVPDFHSWIFGLMTKEEYDRLCIAIPRDHAKTTLAKIAVIHLFIYSPARFLIYISNTAAVAQMAIRDIAAFIRSPACVNIYGPAIFHQAEEARGNYMFTWRNRKYIMRALGAGQQVRGLNVDNQRPNIAVVDDLETPEEGEDNRMGYKGLKNWFYGSFQKAMDKRRNRIIQIGNLTSNKTILYDHLTSPRWKSVCLGAITPDGKPLWPARWTLQALKEELIDYIREGQLYRWLAEMMNLPSTSTNQLIDASKLVATEQVYPDSDKILLRCITVDPAISANMAHANACVIVVHVYCGEFWQIGEKASLYGANPYKVYDKILELSLKWRVAFVGIEDTGYQASLIHICQHENAIRKYNAFVAVPLKHGNKSKHSRILTWIGMITKGLYRLTLADFDIYEQINKYDLTRDNNQDDEIDACAYITQMIQIYLKQIVNHRYTGKIAGKSLAITHHVR